MACHSFLLLKNKTACHLFGTDNIKNTNFIQRLKIISQYNDNSTN